MKKPRLLGTLCACLFSLISITVDAVIIGSFDSSRARYPFEPNNYMYGTLLSEIDARGDSIQTFSEITRYNLQEIDIFYVSSLSPTTGTLSMSEQNALYDWVNEGGTLFAAGSAGSPGYIAAEYASFLNPFDINPTNQFCGSSCNGACSVTVTPSPITKGLEWIDTIYSDPGNDVGLGMSFFEPLDSGSPGGWPCPKDWPDSYNLLIKDDSEDAFLLQKSVELGQVVAFFDGGVFTDRELRNNDEYYWLTLFLNVLDSVCHPIAFNPGQENFDSDGDGVRNSSDAFPDNPNETVDSDNDGAGNNEDQDDDNDNVLDGYDNCPLTFNPDQFNDDDNDGVGNVCDAFPDNPDETVDTDVDRIGNNEDSDDDNDDYLDINDNCPLVFNTDQADFDDDSTGDACDAFPDDPGETIDTDGDRIGNNEDPDDDNDGVTDEADAFPLNPFETDDTDSDGTGNNEDLDDDNDGVTDEADAFPLNPFETVDTDGDGTGNNADLDDDNDGLSDTDEATHGTNPLLTDTDGDDFDDHMEVTYGSNPLVNSDTPTGNYVNNGDINNDSKVDVVDVLLATRIVLGLLEPSTERQVRADVVPDKQINAGDLVRIQKLALSL